MGDVCAACPSSCKECKDSSGTMECTKCNDKYALDSKKACVKCPSNCNKCTASGTTVKCSECEIGYSLSGDQTACNDCGTAAFSNCANCTASDSSSNKANCTACASGYTLEDGLGYKSCKDVSALTCGSGSYSDPAAQCSACSSGFSLTKNMLCARKCYSCGDVDAKTYVDKAKCKIPASGANATDDDAKVVECLNGICVAFFSGGKVAAGCLPANDATGKCDGDRATSETCKAAGETKMCERCCSGENCNSFVADLDGEPDSAMMTAVNMLMLVAAAFIACFHI